MNWIQYSGFFLIYKWQDDKSPDDEDWEYVEEGPAEIIWKDNEIIVKKKRIKVPKRSANQVLTKTEVIRTFMFASIKFFVTSWFQALFQYVLDGKVVYS